MRYVQIITVAKANINNEEREMVSYLEVEGNETLKFLEKAAKESALRVLVQYGGGKVTYNKASWISEIEYKRWELKNKHFRVKKGAR